MEVEGDKGSPLVFSADLHSTPMETGSRQDKSVMSCLVNCVHVADTNKTRQDSFVLSVSTV